MRGCGRVRRRACARAPCCAACSAERVGKASLRGNLCDRAPCDARRGESLSSPRLHPLRAVGRELYSLSADASPKDATASPQTSRWNRRAVTFILAFRFRPRADAGAGRFRRRLTLLSKGERGEGLTDGAE